MTMQCHFKQNCTLKLYIVFKMVYYCCYGGIQIFQITSKKGFITSTTAGLGVGTHAGVTRNAASFQSISPSVSLISVTFVSIYIGLLLDLLSRRRRRQCDQIGRFIGLWATFNSFWQKLISPKLPNSQAIFCKGVTIYHFSSEIILGNFCRLLAIFLWSHWSSTASTSLDAQ